MYSFIKATIMGTALLAGMSWVSAAEEVQKGDKTMLQSLTFSGPYSFKNLDIFLVHGKECLKGQKFLTLEEALKKELAIVHETGNVQNLAIENLSEEFHLYIQSGEIVKGGKQDRVIALDLVLTPKSGRVPIGSFCVEQGRWQARGREKAAMFGSSENAVTSKSLKMASKYNSSQSEVWKEVGEAQQKLSENVGESVRSAQSGSSLQLSLENEAVKHSSDEYIQKLLPIVEEKKDAIGFSFAINGKLNSGDVYGSRDLFLKLWPKLLMASAIEALSEFQRDLKFDPAKISDVETSFSDAQTGKIIKSGENGNIEMVVREDPKNVLFETSEKQAEPSQEKNIDEEEKGWIHLNHICK